MIQDIYDLNPDVTLLVIGMYDTSARLEEDLAESKTAYIKHGISKLIISTANKPMIAGAEKFGYIYVDTAGTLFETNHPTVEGHRHIANRILEELPDARFQYSADVTIRNLSYKAIEYMTINGYIDGTSASTFSPDETFTEVVFSKALNKITDSYKITDSTKAISKLKLIYDLFSITDKSDFFCLIDLLSFSFRVLVTGDNKITRAEGADILYSYIQNFVK